MKSLGHCSSALLLTLLCALGTPASARTFTSPDGRTLEGEIVSATPDMVTLKLASGQVLAAPVSRFSTADQTFITEWNKANPAKIKYAFDVAFSKEKKSAMKPRRMNNHTITTESWVCNMKITNRSGQTLENVVVDYDVFFTEYGDGTPVVRKLTAKASISAIKNLETLVIPSQEVNLSEYQLDGGFYYPDGSRARKKESIEGMTLRFNHATNAAAFTWTSQNAPKSGVPVSFGTVSPSGQ